MLYETALRTVRLAMNLRKRNGYAAEEGGRIEGRIESRGAAAIEFALILPVLILLLFGTVEFGLLLYNQQIITNASREGARAGIVAGSSRPTDGDIRGLVRTYCEHNLVSFGSASEPLIDIVPAGDRSGSAFGDDLEVTVRYMYGFLVLSAFGLTPVDLTAKTVMKME